MNTKIKEALKMMRNKLNKTFPKSTDVRAVDLIHLYNRAGGTNNKEDENIILKLIIEALSYPKVQE